MKKLILVLIAVIMTFTANQALALPSLQLDIDGGWYNPAGGSSLYDEETIVASDSLFTLYALLTPGQDGVPAFNVFQKDGVDNDAYLSIAVYPKMAIGDGGNYGSFTIDGGTPIVVTNDMAHGTPPNDDAELQSHGIFDTYYYEVGFDWDSANEITSYNSQDRAINGGALSLSSGTGTYYIPFVIDVSGIPIAADTVKQISLHFDLYTSDWNGDGKLEYKAPFSHDAQASPVPEPATMLLFGTGLIGLAGLGRKKLMKS